MNAVTLTFDIFERYVYTQRFHNKTSKFI